VNAADPAYVAARRVLLDALGALEDHLPSLVLVGAQAIYLRTQVSRLRSAPYTTDGDLAINPNLLLEEPELGATMTGAGFTLEPSGNRSLQPGLWYKAVLVDGSPSEVEIDLLVPQAAIAHGNERGARLPNHSRRASRLVSGIEAALVDCSNVPISALEQDDDRVVNCNVAGEVALIVAKVHKLRDRIDAPGASGRRLADKDAGDVVRLLLGTDAAYVAARLKSLAEDPIAGPVVAEAIVLFPELFGGRRTPGTTMAVSALASDLPAGQVEVICQEFAGVIRSD
jgi:hypothetical protein